MNIPPGIELFDGDGLIQRLTLPPAGAVPRSIRTRAGEFRTGFPFSAARVSDSLVVGREHNKKKKKIFFYPFLRFCKIAKRQADDHTRTHAPPISARARLKNYRCRPVHFEPSSGNHTPLLHGRRSRDSIRVSTSAKRSPVVAVSADPKPTVSP